MIRLSGLTEQDVPITFTGLRPGEKLDEALWEDGAHVEPSGRTGIRRVHEPLAMQSEALVPAIDGLVAAAERHDLARLYAMIRTMLPHSTLQRTADLAGPATPATVVALPLRQA
jgi:O-antigen biosynthesis protein WbqV